MSRSPDWMGYLGLGLLYTQDAERDSAQLTLSWGPQLLAMVPAGSPAAEWLTSLRPQGTGLATWQGLSRAEAELLDR